MTSSISRELERLSGSKSPLDCCVFQSSGHWSSDLRCFASQRILGELAVKEALMSDFRPNLVSYYVRKITELTYVQSN